MLKRPFFVLAFLLIFLPMSTAAAQRCYDELSAGRSANDLALPVDGRGAARLLKRAVELLEPSLPPLVRVVDLPVPADDPVLAGLRYLRCLHDQRWWTAPSALADQIVRDRRAMELGFTDGSIRLLDPRSPAAQALSDLVGELTGKDAAGGQGRG